MTAEKKRISEQVQASRILGFTRDLINVLSPNTWSIPNVKGLLKKHHIYDQAHVINSLMEAGVVRRRLSKAPGTGRKPYEYVSNTKGHVIDYNFALKIHKAREKRPVKEIAHVVVEVKPQVAVKRGELTKAIVQQRINGNPVIRKIADELYEQYEAHMRGAEHTKEALLNLIGRD